MVLVADPAGAAFGVWTTGAHRGAQRVNEPSAYANELSSSAKPCSLTRRARPSRSAS
jgi:hypothetical protein